MRYDLRLLSAAQANNLTMVSTCLKYVSKETINSCSSFNDTALHSAASHKVSDIPRLLIAAGANPNIRNTIKQTPLHVAATSGNVQAVECLLVAGAALDEKDHIGNTPLYYAATAGHVEVMELLLAADAQVLLKNNEHKTIFDKLRELNKPELIELIECYQLEFEII